MDLLIKGGTIVTAKESFAADVAVKDGKIVAIGKDLPFEAEKVVDASGRLVLPGALDVHTHMAMPLAERFRQTVIFQEQELRHVAVLQQFLIILYSIRDRQFSAFVEKKTTFLKRKPALITPFIAV